MQNSVRIESIPVPIRFAGWESDTYRLQKAGWQIAANDVFTPWTASSSVQLILRHEASKIHAMTAPLELRPHIYSMDRYFRDDPSTTHMMLAGFDIIAMGSQVQVHVIHRPEFSFKDFHPVDCEPRTLHEERVDIANLKIFRPISSDAPEIIIPTQSVAEMMDMVLKLQDPVQKEIRDRRRAEKLRGNWQEKGYDAHADIRCQILAFG
jgi:hypothetical protein